ncbi:MAG: hypothetical protein M5U22_23100, partial [Thermoleophilia bacterium]|nr:hypothetical protein [Thermoleophilia bacterium]
GWEQRRRRRRIDCGYCGRRVPGEDERVPGDCLAGMVRTSRAVRESATGGKGCPVDQDQPSAVTGSQEEEGRRRDRRRAALPGPPDPPARRRGVALYLWNDSLEARTRAAQAEATEIQKKVQSLQKVREKLAEDEKQQALLEEQNRSSSGSRTARAACRTCCCSSTMR